MDRHRASAIAHRRHPIAAPLSAASVAKLLSWLTPPPTGLAVDLGCGSGEWLAAVLSLHQRMTGVGVDKAPDAVAEARARHPGDRLTWVEADAASYAGPLADVSLCVGASHAFGGLAQTLAALRERLRPDGQAILGDGFWERPPSATTQRVLEARPDQLPNVAGLVEAAQVAGFEVVFGHISTPAEWDDYEWSWTGSLTHWALTEAADDEREAALAIARDHRAGWLTGYRGELGFCSLVLQRITPKTPGGVVMLNASALLA